MNLINLLMIFLIFISVVFFFGSFLNYTIAIQLDLLCYILRTLWTKHYAISYETNYFSLCISFFFFDKPCTRTSPNQYFFA